MNWDYRNYANTFDCKNGSTFWSHKKNFWEWGRYFANKPKISVNEEITKLIVVLGAYYFRGDEKKDIPALGPSMNVERASLILKKLQQWGFKITDRVRGFIDQFTSYRSKSFVDHSSSKLEDLRKRNRFPEKLTEEQRRRQQKANDKSSKKAEKRILEAYKHLKSLHPDIEPSLRQIGRIAGSHFNTIKRILDLHLRGIQSSKIQPSREKPGTLKSSPSFTFNDSIAELPPYITNSFFDSKKKSCLQKEISFISGETAIEYPRTLTDSAVQAIQSLSGGPTVKTEAPSRSTQSQSQTWMEKTLNMFTPRKKMDLDPGIKNGLKALSEKCSIEKTRKDELIDLEIKAGLKALADKYGVEGKQVIIPENNLPMGEMMWENELKRLKEVERYYGTNEYID